MYNNSYQLIKNYHFYHYFNPIEIVTFFGYDASTIFYHVEKIPSFLSHKKLITKKYNFIAL